MQLLIIGTLLKFLKKLKNTDDLYDIIQINRIRKFIIIIYENLEISLSILVLCVFLILYLRYRINKNQFVLGQSEEELDLTRLIAPKTSRASNLLGVLYVIIVTIVTIAVVYWISKP